MRTVIIYATPTTEICRAIQVPSLGVIVTGLSPSEMALYDGFREIMNWDTGELTKPNDPAAFFAAFKRFWSGQSSGYRDCVLGGGQDASACPMQAWR